MTSGPAAIARLQQPVVTTGCRALGDSLSLRSCFLAGSAVKCLTNFQRSLYDSPPLDKLECRSLCLRQVRRFQDRLTESIEKEVELC